ncbi:MAG TPA: hypothetical protein VMV32_08260 [Ignavibacteriaceae bacterium]|nr:hypothetical protein [Ignavibacteriaceae bacterium]
MSWSIGFIGKPENIHAAIEKESEKLSGQSKIEFDDAAPHLIALVEQNFDNRENPCPITLKIHASGSGFADTGGQHNRSCTVLIESFYEDLV